MVGLAVDLDGNAAIVDGARVRLRPMEAEILHLLNRHPGATVLHETMVERIYGARTDADQPLDALACIKVVLVHLRKRLAGHGVVIEAVWGKGWRLASA